MILILPKLIELWETFLMQLDADEDGEPFFKPQAINPAPIRQPHKGDQQGEPGNGPGTTGGEGQQGAAAVATAEQEE